jgi:hypothetical protein
VAEPAPCCVQEMSKGVLGAGVAVQRQTTMAMVLCLMQQQYKSVRCCAVMRLARGRYREVG